MIFMNVMLGFRMGMGAVCLLLPVLLAGCGNSSGADAGAEPNGEVPTITVITPERKMLTRTTTQPATVSGYFEADIYAKVTGYLTELHHDIGDSVEADAPLGVVSVPEMVKQLERQEALIRKLQADETRADSAWQVAQSLKAAAEAELEQAEAEVTKTTASLTADRRELDRTRDLVQRRSLTERMLDESQKRFESSEAAEVAAKAGVTSATAHVTVSASKVAVAVAEQSAAKAQTEVAQKQLEEMQALMNYATLKAPFAGVVTARNVDVGDLVRNTQSGSDGHHKPLFSVVQVDKVRVRIAIPENDAPWANPDDAVSLRLRAIPGPAIESKLKRISGRLDPSTRTMLAEVELENTEREVKLLPGMFGEATITLAEREGLVLPAGVVRHDEKGNSYVYTVGSDNTITRVEVTTGLDDGNEIEITKGLSGSERVVTATIGRLAPGQKVNVE